MKYFGDEKAKKMPKGTDGASVVTGLSEHSKFDAMKQNQAGVGMGDEQARSTRKMHKIPGGGFEFDGNDMEL